MLALDVLFKSYHWVIKMPSREEIVHDISAIANWCEDQAASSALMDLARQVENMRCENCDYKEELLNEMAEALEEIVRCLSHGLQDCRASITAKDMLRKYHEQIGELK